jgi:hypothetical protein
MIASAPILTATIDALFRELNRRGIRYAVLRNYERFPALERDGDPTARTDIDLAVHAGDLPVWREVARSVAAQEGWDILTECDHWMQSAAPQHHSEAFRFYRLSPLEFVQVDLFHHGYVLWGLPVFDLQELLAGRVLNDTGGFAQIDPMKENVIRLLKVEGLCRGDPASPKLARYRRKLLRFWAAEQASFARHLRAKFFIFGEQALRALQQGDMARFARKMRLARVCFLARFALSHPLQAPRCLVARALDNRTRFVTRPCGCVVNVYAPAEPQRRLLRSVMNELAARNVFEAWEEKSPGSALTAGQRAVMEQGGLVVQWSDRASARIDVQKSERSPTLIREVVRILAQQDHILYLRPALAGFQSWSQT